MPQFLLLTSQGCTPCLRVKRILKELQAKFPAIAIQEVEFTSPTGAKLAIENSVLYPPALFLDGKLLAKGKIYEDQIIAAVKTPGVCT